ncbi:MAG: VOC family protein [Verrucomicrobia bacterium]|nr:VOC family protein [Verrucomicrobiota bacterium]
MNLRALRTAFAVSDMDRSIAFYTQMLGFQLLYDKIRDGVSFETMLGIPGVRLRVAAMKDSGGSGHLLELIEYLHPQPAPRKSGGHGTFVEIGSANVCYMVDDLAAIFERLKAANAECVNPPADYVRDGIRMGKIMFALDPDRIPIGLFEPAKEPD